MYEYQKLSFLEEDLFKLESSDAAVISEVIHKYSEQPCVKQQSALFRLVFTENAEQK